MTTQPLKCPHCGAEKSTYIEQTGFWCGTYLRMMDGGMGLEYVQSLGCRYAAQLRKERDEARGLLREAFPIVCCYGSIDLEERIEQTIKDL